LREKPEVQRIVTLTGIPDTHVCGYLDCFWGWVDQQADIDEQVLGGGLLPGVGTADLCRMFAPSPPEFWDAVQSVGWITLSDRGVLIPGFAARFSEQALKRAIENKRKRCERMVKVIEDLMQDGPPRRSRRRAAPKSSQSDSIDMEQGAADLQASVFEKITLTMLSNTRELLEWWAWACHQPRPVGLNDLFHQEKLLAAAERAIHHSGPNVKSPIVNPIGFVVNVMKFGRWQSLEPEDIARGRARLLRSEKIAEQRTTTLHECLQSAPAERSPTKTEQRVAAIKFDMSRKKA
jgi:hypothetical protein